MTLKDQFVKIAVGLATHWLKVKMNKNGVPANPQNLLGISLKDDREYSFTPSDVVAFYEGNLESVMGLGMQYIPTSDVCNILDTVVPDSMGYEIHIALRIIQEKLGKPLHKYVAEKLHYTETELCNALSAEQVDAVAMAIYNIEERKQGLIVGDQTGIGKGRVAAAMIRYGCKNGMKPIFISEKPNLFTDIYRDLIDIYSRDLKPFIVNSRDARTNIKDKKGNIIYSALLKNEQEEILLSKKLPNRFDFICSTYSQFSSPLKKVVKPNFLHELAENNLIIMDESHNASGTSNTGEFLQNVLRRSKGVVFLSATFAKRPDNMPIYAMKTAISDINMTHEKLIEAVIKGGVALQEIISSQLVAEGQMIRRERSFEGVEVNYITLTEKELIHKAVYDNIAGILMDIIDFQGNYISNMVKEMDKEVAAEGKEAETRKGTSKAGVDNQPMFSRIFQFVNQMLFSIKAKDVALKAIERLREGKKPIIAFSSTMESFFNDMKKEDGTAVKSGDTVNLDYRVVVEKALQSVMKYTVIDVNGDREHKYFEFEDLEPQAQEAYVAIVNKIEDMPESITISPIDVIKNSVRKAGFSIEEVTGRKTEIKLIEGTNRGVLMNRKKVLANDAFRMFNDNEIDCLMINQSGSTGASAHAIVTDKVPENDVKQRVMIVLQPELDINREVQKRGRINRTGQILKPIYDYISSAIPAERRLMMMLQKKLKSLDANTTSNQKQSENMLKTDDFLNKYGDKIVTEYLVENEDLNKKIDNPLFLKSKDSTDNIKIIENAASKVAGRVAVLKTEEQEQFYSDVLERYNDYVDYLKQAGEYDLEVEALKLNAETKQTKVVIQGKTGESVFSESTYLEEVEVDNLRKPYSKSEIEVLINKNLDGKTAEKIQTELKEEIKNFYEKRASDHIQEIEEKNKKAIQNIVKEKKYKKLETKSEKENYIETRTESIVSAKKTAIENVELKNKNTHNSISHFISFFKIGKELIFDRNFNMFAPTIAICLGYSIDRKKKNPFAPSAIKIRLAISSSLKYLELSLSGESAKKLSEIMGQSRGYSYSNVLDRWDENCKKSSSERKTVYIVTGNILQGFSKYQGKLISFTTKDGSVRKGILMPDNFDPVKSGGNYVSVPFDKTAKYILDISSSIIVDAGKIKLEKTWSGLYKLYTPTNKNYQNIYKDNEIIELCNNKQDGFVRVGGAMTAIFEKEKVEKLCAILGLKHNLSINIHPNVYNTYFSDVEEQDKEDKTVKTNKTTIQAKAEKLYELDKEKFSKRNEDSAKRLMILKARAKIKILKLLKI